MDKWHSFGMIVFTSAFFLSDSLTGTGVAATGGTGAAEAIIQNSNSNEESRSAKGYDGRAFLPFEASVAA
jgi:hypothetical protein